MYKIAFLGSNIPLTLGIKPCSFGDGLHGFPFVGDLYFSL